MHWECVTPFPVRCRQLMAVSISISGGSLTKILRKPRMRESSRTSRAEVVGSDISVLRFDGDPVADRLRRLGRHFRIIGGCGGVDGHLLPREAGQTEEHTSELPSLMRNS